MTTREAATMRRGFMKLMRLGPLEFGEQSRWSRAPERRGMWAFPYPHFDMFFAYHKYSDMLPKRLRESAHRTPLSPEFYRTPEGDAITSLKGYTLDEEWGGYEGLRVDPSFHEARSKWIEEVGKKILPLRTFWYKGDVYSHFTPAGEIGNTGLWDPEATTWTLMDVGRLAEVIQKSGGDKTGPPHKRFKSSVDHLEVFIAPGHGVFRHGANPK